MLSFLDMPIQPSFVWQSLIFFTTSYSILVVTSLCYILPICSTSVFNTPSSVTKNSCYTYLPGNDILKLFVTPILLIAFVNVLWTGFQIMPWFAHITIGTFQVYSTFLILSLFTSLLILLLTKLNVLTFTNSDYLLTIYQFLLWMWLLYSSNNLLTFVFLIEIIGVLITLLVTTSTFSLTNLENIFKKNATSYFNENLPTAFLISLLFFFWISLISSITLFLFISFFFVKAPTFEWGIIESLTVYLLTVTNTKTSFSLSSSWLILVVCLLLKCGIFPFFAWKPSFFKGTSIMSIIFYVYFYFTLLLIFIMETLLNLTHELFYSTISQLTIVLVCGTLIFSTTLLNTHYIKTFIAFSSILNTALVLHALFSITFVDVNLLL